MHVTFLFSPYKTKSKVLTLSLIQYIKSSFFWSEPLTAQWFVDLSEMWLKSLDYTWSAAGGSIIYTDTQPSITTFSYYNVASAHKSLKVLTNMFWTSL